VRRGAFSSEDFVFNLGATDPTAGEGGGDPRPQWRPGTAAGGAKGAKGERRRGDASGRRIFLGGDSARSGGD
jgi:hypothetical protein